MPGDNSSPCGPLIALIFLPFYAISLIISDPRAPIVQIFTYFPLSAAESRERGKKPVQVRRERPISATPTATNQTHISSP
jgi:hypothetical protein